MSAEVVLIVRAFFESVVADDSDAIRARLDPEVVWFGTRGGLDENQVLHGPDAWFQYMDEIRAQWERFDVEAERFIDAGDAVVVFLREAARARHDDLDVESRTAMIVKVRGQRIVEVTGYLDRDEALRAAGVA